MIRRRTSGWWTKTIQSGDGLLVLEVDDTIAGYATMGAARVRGNHEGEIYEIYVVPSHQGLGFGERLFEGCRHHLDMRQLCGLVVWALTDNSIATDFYWRRGGRPLDLAVERFGGRKLQKIAFAWD